MILIENIEFVPFFANFAKASAFSSLFADGRLLSHTKSSGKFV